MASESSYVEQFCRLCLKSNTNFQPLFEDQIVEMLESLTSMKVNYNGPGSKLTCFRCLAEVRTAYKTQQKLIRSEMQLQTTINNEIMVKEEIEENCLEDTIKTEVGETAEPQPQEWTFIESQADSNKQALFKCSTCLDEYQNFFDYQEHIQIHKVKQCLMCPKLVSISELKEHNRAHESGYCEYCGKQMKNSHSLRNHVRLSHNGPDIKCEHCGELFRHKDEVDLHMRRIHTKEAKFICDCCGAKFFKAASMTRHFKIKHSKEKPFKCSVCDVKFAIKSKLKIHELKHSDKMLFVCEFCGKGFKFNYNMNLHKKSAHGWKSEDKVKCSLCSSGFPTKFSLSIHVAQKHK